MLLTKVCNVGAPQASVAAANAEALRGSTDWPLITTVILLQLMVGGVTSFSCTLNVQLLVLPKPSVAVRVTVCGLPELSVLPAKGCWVMVVVPHPACKFAKEVKSGSCAVQPGPVDMFCDCGQLMTGPLQLPGEVVTPVDSGLVTLLSRSQLQRVLIVWAGPVCA